MHILKYQNMHNLIIFFSNKHTKTTFILLVRTAGVVVSCKIPILATRVRFPGDAIYFLKFQLLLMIPSICVSSVTARVA